MVAKEIAIDSVEVPAWVLRVCEEWHGGLRCKLYAVASSKGLYVGNRCPVVDYTDNQDKMQKWYLTIWEDFAYDLGAARKIAAKSPDKKQESILSAAEYWADNICDILRTKYNLEDWET